MGAFSFLGSNKKNQQGQRSQANGQSQLSPHYTQDANSTGSLPYHSSSLNSRRSPTPLSSPAYSTVSFFSNTRSTTSRSAYPSDTHSSYQSSFDSVSRVESPSPTPPPKKSRPSLNIIRGGAMPRLSLSKEDGAESPMPFTNNTKGRSPIYMRFGFSKSSTNLPPEVPALPTTEAKFTRKRRNTKDSKFDGDSEDGRSLVGSRPASPTRLIPPMPSLESVPASPPVVFEYGSNPSYTLPSSTSFPTISTYYSDDDVAPGVPPKDDVSPINLRVPDDDDTELSTSLLLQRRRAKSLGNPRADEQGNVNARMDPAHRITNLRLPALPYPPLPIVSPTPTGTTLTLPQRVSSRSSSPSTSRASTPTTETTIAVPKTPMTATASTCSGSSRARSESSCGGSSRTRSESGCSGSTPPLAPFLRTRSESGSSRARSESNASSNSSRRSSSKAKQRVTMIKMEDLWGEFLKEVDEDMQDLCTTPIRKLHDGDSPRTPTTTRPLREKPSSPPPLPRSGSQNDLVKPLSTTSATFTSMPSPSVFTYQRSRGKTLPATAIFARDEDRRVAQDPPPPQTPPIFIEKQDTDPQNVNTDTLDISNLPSIPSLPSTEITIVHPEGSDSASMDATDTNNSLKLGGSPSSLPYLYSPDPSASTAEPQLMDVNRCSTYSTHSVHSTLSFADSTRPDSTCSEFSQFSLSLFPAPPSVSVIRPTTQTGTFRVGTAASTATDVNADDKEESPEVKPLQFKSILARSPEFNKPERNEPPSAWNSRRTNLRPKAGISASRYSSLFLDQTSSSSDADSALPTPTSLLHSGAMTAPTTPTASTNAETNEGPQSQASPIRGSSKKATTPNYDALLRSMHATFPVASAGGKAGSRPGTADGKFQEWGYAF